MLSFLTGSCSRSLDAKWNKKCMKILSVKNTHEKSNWVKNWLWKNSTLRNFSKTNSSPHDFTSPHVASKKLFLAQCRVWLMKKPKFHIDQSSIENGWVWWKNENPCFENFSEVTVFNLAIKEDEESPWFLEVWKWKHQNRFFTIDFVYQDLFESIFIFENGWAETEILQSGDFGQQ